LLSSLTTYIAHANVLDQVGIQVALFVDFLQQAVDQEVKIGVLETALLALGQRRSDGEGDNDIVGVLLGATRASNQFEDAGDSWRIHSHGTDPALAGRQVRKKRAEALSSHVAGLG
jgi:hypothetical protein